MSPAANFILKPRKKKGGNPFTNREEEILRLQVEELANIDPVKAPTGDTRDLKKICRFLESVETCLNKLILGVKQHQKLMAKELVMRPTYEEEASNMRENLNGSIVAGHDPEDENDALSRQHTPAQSRLDDGSRKRGYTFEIQTRRGSGLDKIDEAIPVRNLTANLTANDRVSNKYLSKHFDAQRTQPDLSLNLKVQRLTSLD